jgi:hypothetical protein
MFSCSPGPTHVARTDSSPPILNHPNQKIPTRRWDKGAPPTNLHPPPRKVDLKTATHPPWPSYILHPPHTCAIQNCLVSPPLRLPALLHRDMLHKRDETSLPVSSALRQCIQKSLRTMLVAASITPGHQFLEQVVPVMHYWAIISLVVV